MMIVAGHGDGAWWCLEKMKKEEKVGEECRGKREERKRNVGEKRKEKRKEEKKRKEKGNWVLGGVGWIN